MQSRTENVASSRKVMLPRNVWGRGATGGFLYNSSSRTYDVIGWMMKECGFCDGELDGAMFANDRARKWRWRTDTFGLLVGDFEYHLMDINDREDISEDEREALLIEVCKEHGVVLTFEGENS